MILPQNQLITVPLLSATGLETLLVSPTNKQPAITAIKATPTINFFMVYDPPFLLQGHHKGHELLNLYCKMPIILLLAKFILK